MADSHDNLPRITQAVKIFTREKVELVLHCGDFISPFTARVFKGLNCRLIGVFGNNDGEKFGLRKSFRDIGEIYEDFYEGEFSGRKFILLHKERLVEPLSRSGKYEVIIYGHTHRPEVRRGKVLVVNPGECGGWLNGNPTVGILDVEKLEVDIVPLKGR